MQNNPERHTIIKMIFPIGERASVISVVDPDGFWESDVLATFTMGEYNDFILQYGEVEA